MALPRIEINLGNGSLGLVPVTTDAVVGIVLNGVATTQLALLTAKQVSSLKEAEALGITSAYDTANNVKVWFHIKEFYDAAGTEIGRASCRERV